MNRCPSENTIGRTFKNCFSHITWVSYDNVSCTFSDSCDSICDNHGLSHNCVYSGINPHSYTVFSLTRTGFNPLNDIDEIISVDVSKLPFSHTEIAEPVGTSLPPLSFLCGCHGSESYQH